jgi:hypothetical protein
MLKRIAATAGVAIFVFGAGAGVAQADGHGNAWGKKAGACVSELGSLGQVMQAVRTDGVHNTLYTPQQIATSHGC